MINLNEIMSVYSGRPGCCCGCRGKHTYASKYATKASKDRGYKVNEDEISDRSVKIIVGKMNKQFDNVKKDGNSHYFLDCGERWLAAYLVK
jgi:hypothetical protein